MASKRDIKTQKSAAKIKLSKFDLELAAAVNDASKDAVNFHHAAGRAVFGRKTAAAKLQELSPPGTELIPS